MIESVVIVDVIHSFKGGVLGVYPLGFFDIKRKVVSKIDLTFIISTGRVKENVEFFQDSVDFGNPAFPRLCGDEFRRFVFPHYIINQSFISC
jgi:hypothetical protein